MIVLNFIDLNEEAKQRLLEKAKRDVEIRFGEAIIQYANHRLVNYKDLIAAEAQRQLYEYQYRFQI